MTVIDPPALSHTADLVRGVSIPMRDGVLLYADIYGPTQAPRPVILERTPYGRQLSDTSEHRSGEAAPPPRVGIAQHYVEAGFLYVIADCRGTGASEGVFDKYVQEAADGEDTLAFVLAAPWCDGRVAMVGHSYGASCQVSVAALGTGQLAAIVADCGGFSDALASGIRQGGAFDQKQATWALKEAIRDLALAGDSDGAARLAAEPVLDWLRRGPWAEGQTPLASAPARQHSLSQFWQQAERSPFWRRPGLFVDSAAGALRRLPGLYVTSWHDTSLRATLDNFSGAAGGAPGTALIIGPWCHGRRHTSRSGDADFGPAALPETGLGAPLIALRTRWIADRLAGRPLDVPAVRYFEMGGGDGTRGADGAIAYGGRWRSASQWPPADGTPYLLHLAPGRLQEAVAPQAAAMSFVSDPEQPVPTCGGAINSGAPVMEGGMFDQTPLFPFTFATDGGAVSGRADVLMLSTPPLTQDLALCGAIAAELYVSSDSLDADLTIKLVDCYPEGGPCLNLGDGILRLRYHAGFEAPHFLTPGVPVRARVEAYPSAALIRAGHRLRLDIAGSNFPHFDSNPQSGGPQGRPGPRRVARITLHMGPRHPSRLDLCVRPVQA